MMRKLISAALAIALGLAGHALAVNMYSSDGITVPVTPAYVLPGAVAVINMLPAGKANFDNASWNKNAIQDATFATKTTAPDGTVTAQKFIATVTNTFHYVFSANINKSAASQTYRYFVDAKVAEYTRVVGQVSDTNGANGIQLLCDLAGITATTVSFGTGFSAANVTATSLENGFVRCFMDVTTNSVSQFRSAINMDNGTGAGAISNSFAGNGVNGVYVWQTSLLPVPVWTLVQKPFEDNFTRLSTIDINNTKTRGFNWYVNNGWPNAGDGGSLSLPWRNSPAQQAGDFSTNGSSVTASLSRASNGIGETIVSAVTDGSTGYIGRTFTPPMYREGSWAFDPTLATTTAGVWPVQWSFPTEYLTGNTGAHVVETDDFEAFPGTGTVATDDNFHDWTISGGSSTNIFRNFTFASGLTFTSQNRYGMLWISQAANGGANGLRQTYINGVYVSNSETSYSSGGIASPAPSPSNPTGVFSAGDTQHYPFMLTAGNGAGGVGNWPVTWTHAVVYCPVAGCMTQNFLLNRDLDQIGHANDNSPVGLGMVG